MCNVASMHAALRHTCRMEALADFHDAQAAWHKEEGMKLRESVAGEVLAGSYASGSVRTAEAVVSGAVAPPLCAVSADYRF